MQLTSCSKIIQGPPCCLYVLLLAICRFSPWNAMGCHEDDSKPRDRIFPAFHIIFGPSGLRFPVAHPRQLVWKRAKSNECNRYSFATANNCYSSFARLCRAALLTTALLHRTK
ncbi:hypothetical protein F5B18DRAFT_594112 [Nemania serpens]|nr:hypothetical protein F5B18DRAFT_594112 [Nemania serpens]